MPEMTLLKIDAFTDTPFSGNPCAVVMDADDLSADQMQAIAQEMNLSETAFVMGSERAHFRARYFTPAEEIPLAGHPTVATTIALLDTGKLPVPDVPMVFSLELEAGVIQVAVEKEEEKAPRVTMTQLKPEFLRTYSAEEVAPAFGLLPDDFRADVPLQTVSTGTPMLMAPVASSEALKKAVLHLDVYRELKKQGDFFSVHLFLLGGATEEGDTFARHLGVPPDTIEDPFTGSATGCMGAYLWRYGLLDEPRFVAEQGHWMGRPGTAQVQILGSREDIRAVRVGGPGVTVLRGKLSL